jgi:predicted TIM-barrel fold metal-dependent hydrolase
VEIIDSHTHVGQFGQWNCSCETLITSMNKFGVSQGIVSTINGNEFNYELNKVKTYKDQIKINDDMLKEIKKYEGKLKALFWIRPYSENADKELEDYLKINREWFVGLKVHPRCANLKFSVENYHTYLELCKKLSLSFCVHTQRDGFSNIEYIYNVARQYPDVKFIAIHMEMGTNHQDAIQYIKRCSNLFGDTTMVEIDDVINAIRICGSKKILFGSDAVVFGEESYKRYDNFKEKLLNTFSRMEIEDLFCNNAKQIFKFI